MYVIQYRDVYPITTSLHSQDSGKLDLTRDTGCKEDPLEDPDDGGPGTPAPGAASGAGAGAGTAPSARSGIGGIASTGLRNITSVKSFNISKACLQHIVQ